MRRIDEVVSELTPRGAPPPARILIVAAKAAAAAGRDYDAVIEIDERPEGAQARMRGAAAQWAQLTEAWLADALAPFAGRPRLVRANSWPLLSRLVKTAGVTFAAVELLVVQVPSAADDAGRTDAAGSIKALLGSIGFRLAELALPTDRRRDDVVLAVASREKAAAPAERVAQEIAALEIADHEVAFADGYATGRIRLAAAPKGRVFVSVLAGESPVAIAEARPAEAGDPRELSFRLWAAPEMFSATGQSLTVAVFAAPPLTPVATIARPAGRRFAPDAILKAHADGLAGAAPREPFGVLVVGGARETPLRVALKSLAAQGAAGSTHVWLDGDPANPARLSASAQTARDSGAREVRAFGGRTGADKLMIHALDVMTRRYDAVLVLDDGCAPARDAVTAFRAALAEARGDGSVLSVYGQPFGFERGRGPFRRFQSRGWAAFGDRLAPLLPKLAYLYSLEEADFLAWAAERLTDEVRAAIDLTPGRQPSETLARRFDWGEALGLVAALDGMTHAPTARRVVFDCGPAEGLSRDAAERDAFVDEGELEALVR